MTGLRNQGENQRWQRPIRDLQAAASYFDLLFPEQFSLQFSSLHEIWITLYFSFDKVCSP